MKPRLRLHADGTVSLAEAHLDFRFYCNVKSLRQRRIDRSGQIKRNCQLALGSISAYCRHFGVPTALLGAALNVRNKEFALGGAAGSLRVLLGLPTHSSGYTQALSSDFRVPLRALVVATKEVAQ